MKSFSDTYSEARSKFVSAAHDAGARIHTYGPAGLAGKHGETLHCDVAILGPARAEKAAVIVAGTHGAEGFCGSAILHRWLSEFRDAGPAQDTKVVLVHAISPWAFSHMTRANENNVDLNRNFLAVGAKASGRNRSYDLLVPFLHAQSVEADQSLAAYNAYRACLLKHGSHIETEAWQGQTQHPEGLFYSGLQPEWSNRTFRDIIHEHLEVSSTIGFIDWHTGVGSYGEIVHLIFDAPGSAEHAAATGWWSGTDLAAAAFSAGVVPKYEGLLCKAIRQELPAARIAGAVIEFGVADDFAIFRSDRLDRWLRFDGRNDLRHDRLRREYRDSCCPDDMLWRGLVLREGPRKINQLIDGIRRWKIS